MTGKEEGNEKEEEYVMVEVVDKDKGENKGMIRREIYRKRGIEKMEEDWRMAVYI